MTRTLLIAVLLVFAAAPAAGQISAKKRAHKFWTVFQKADPNGKALAFDILDPADDPKVLTACFAALKNTHPLVMQSAIRFLRKATGEETFRHLSEKGAAHRNRHVRYAVARALPALLDPGAVERLRSLGADEDWLVRCAALQGLGEKHDVEAVEDVARAMEDEEPRVRICAMDAVAAMKDLRGTDAIITGLKDPCWQVRAAAIDAARAVRPRAAIEALIDRMDAEKGRLRLAAYRALVWLAGKDLGEDPGNWREWWAGQVRKKGKKGKIEREYDEYKITRRKSVPRRFFKVPTDSRRLVFVLDLSQSMTGSSSPLKPENPHKTRVGGVTRFTMVVDELLSIVMSFDENVHFNIIVFSTNVRLWKPDLVKATPTNRSKAISFVRSRTPDGETNVFDALARAFGVSKGALRTGKGYFDEMAGKKSALGFESGPDTIFLLSDGVPNRGQITESDRIVEEITRANRLRRLVIHTIAVSQFSDDFLRELAVKNGGKAVSVGK
jgi:hypothetical protein